VESRDKGLSWKESSQDDFQANGIAKVPLIVARYAGSTQLTSKVEDMVGILQNTALSVSNSVLYAKILGEVLLTNEHPSKALTSLLSSTTLSTYERTVLGFVTSDEKIAEWVQFSDDLAAVELLEGESPWTGMKIKGSIITHHLKTGGSVAETLASVTGLGADETAILSRLKHTESAKGQTHNVNKVAAAIGLSCALPGALVASLYIARVSSTFEEAVTSNILAGGDNCSRAMVVGALFGAWSGDTSSLDRTEGQSLPAGWTDKVNADLWREIVEGADKIASDNKSL
jgi:ADP-ribosylglycohydrolase